MTQRKIPGCGADPGQKKPPRRTEPGGCLAPCHSVPGEWVSGEWRDPLVRGRERAVAAPSGHDVVAIVVVHVVVFTRLVVEFGFVVDVITVFVLEVVFL